MKHDNFDIQQKHWNEMKAAVGTMVHQPVKGLGSLDDLLLNVKNIGFQDLVCQTDVQTEEDKARLRDKGYRIEYTEAQFREKYKVDPSCIWYTASVAQDCLYFNPETLAANPFPVELFLAGIYKDPAGLEASVAMREADVANHNYWGSLISLPDAMRMEYFNRLVEKKGSQIPDLYQLFISNYTDSDYGFRNLSPKALDAIFSAKTEEEAAHTAEVLKDLPQTLTVYRGGNIASAPPEQGYSWTLDINVANFFASRRGSGEGYIAVAEISKDDILEALLDDRSEAEILIRPKDVRILDEIPIKGMDFIKETLPAVTPMYQNYRDQMMDLCFTQDSAEHGFEHQARVMLNALTIAKHLDLPLRDWRVLATAAIYHDTQRVNDTDDSVHGKAAAEYYLSTTASADPLVAFLCEYHCLPDEQGYKEIEQNKKLGKSRSRAKLLYDIFKDADGLERVRFGIRALDLNQLRLPISKQLTLAARIYWDQIRVPGKPKLRKPSLSTQVASAANRSGKQHPQHEEKTNQTVR